MEKQYPDWDLESSRDAKDVSAHAYSWVSSSALNNKPLLLVACTYLSTRRTARMSAAVGALELLARIERKNNRSGLVMMAKYI